MSLTLTLARLLPLSPTVTALSCFLVGTTRTGWVDNEMNKNCLDDEGQIVVNRSHSTWRPQRSVLTSILFNIFMGI